MLDLIAHLLSIKGRAGRVEFWLFNLVFFIVSGLPALAFYLLVTPANGVYWPLDITQLQFSPLLIELIMSPMLKPMLYIYGGILVTFWIMLFTTITRRLHDINISGWWVLAYVVIVFGATATTVLLELYQPEMAASLYEFYFENHVWIKGLLAIVHAIYIVLAFFWPGNHSTNRYGRSEWEVNTYIKLRRAEKKMKKQQQRLNNAS